MKLKYALKPEDITESHYAILEFSTYQSCEKDTFGNFQIIPCHQYYYTTSFDEWKEEMLNRLVDVKNTSKFVAFHVDILADPKVKVVI